MNAAVAYPDRHTSSIYALWAAGNRIDKSGLARLLTPTETSVLHALIRRMDATNWSTWVGVETMAFYLGSGRSSIQTAFRGLEAKGLIHTAARFGRSSITRLTPDFIDWLNGPQIEAPTRPDSSRKPRGTRPDSGPKQSNALSNRVKEQQTEPEPAAPVVVSSIELPEDLVQFAESDKTISKTTVAKMIERHGVDRVRQAIEFIQTQYDKREIRVLNRGGLFRSTVENGYQSPVQIKEQVQAKKAAVIELHRPEPGATWGRSPGGQVVTVLCVMPDCVHIQDAKGVARVVLNWAMDGWAWGI